MIFDDRIIGLTEGYDWVSIDIFDTLLVRPYVEPKDLFVHIEKEYDSPGFCRERMDAERRNRDPENGEVTFDAIYEDIDPRYSHLRSAELEFENRSVVPKVIRDTFAELASGKNVILVSDMYLPTDFIRDLLERNGITGFKDILISGDIGVNKHFGKLFTYALDRFGISPSELIHIGDNPRSDGSVPESLGIRTIHTERPIDEYAKTHPKEMRYYRRRKSPERSIIVSMDMLYWLENRDEGFWRSVSHRFGGPIVTDYCNYIHDNAHDDELKLFVARDGWNLIRVYDVLFGIGQSEYVYAPRILNLALYEDYETNRKYRKYRDVLMSEFCPCKNDDPDSWFDENEDTILKRREVMSKRYASMLDVKTHGIDKVRLVDVTTMKYSSQKLISKFLPGKDVSGIYYNILVDDPKIPHVGYHIRNRKLRFDNHTNIMEFFMSSPEPPIAGLDGDLKPIYMKPHPCEQERLNIYNDVTSGEIDYAERMRSIFGKNIPRIGFDDIKGWLHVLVYGSDTETRRRLTDMKWPVDSKHMEYISMIFHPRDTFYHMKKTVLDIMWYVSLSLK